METVTKRNSNGKFVSVREINFADYSDFAVFRAILFPIKFVVAMQVLPAIAVSDKAAR